LRVFLTTDEKRVLSKAEKKEKKKKKLTVLSLPEKMSLKKKIFFSNFF